MVRDALKKCADNAEGLLKREEEAIKAVFEGLIVNGDSSVTQLKKDCRVYSISLSKPNVL
jgi:hypothetical protein